eukprot:Tbor_TRINITY_DN6022_c0_g1::TRINITY_DN6022_c0_g1_i2::g.10629::m.10629/K07915/RAB28; Ras-related protein Rab-28
MAMNSSSDDEVENLQYKVIIIGDGAVGKTSLINRYCCDGFAQSYKQTIGVDFFNKKISLPRDVHVTLQIWDIGGQQIGGKMLGKYIFGCHAVCYVYDTTNAESFKNIEDWMAFIYDEFKSSGKMPVQVLIGNKIDLPQRQVRTDKHNLFAIENKMMSFFVSAKSGERVNGMFQRIAADLAGIQLTKGEVETTENKIVASIVQHPCAPVPSEVPGPSASTDKDSCIVA